jgi:hypothetical protein
MWSIEQINPTFKDFKFNWIEAYSYGSEALKKHKDKVVAFKITEEHCYLLLKGKIKFFTFKFRIDNESVKRIDNKIFINDKITICDKDVYYIFKKRMIVENL